MVASSCATFMIGPFKPPSAAASSSALAARSSGTPKKRAPANRAAVPPSCVPTFAYRRARAENRFFSRSDMNLGYPVCHQYWQLNGGYQWIAVYDESALRVELLHI